MIVTLLIATFAHTAACALARAAEPFPEVELPRPAAHSHRWAYASMLAGAGLIGASFAWEQRADDNYRRYLASTDPGEIGALYARTRRDDNLSTASLVSGEALVAAGLYLRFLRRSATERVALDWRPDRCAVSLRF
jgi:hypothetical protein